MPNLRLLAASALVCLASAVSAQTPSAVLADPAPDKANPAAMQSFGLPSHGVQLNALVYVAAGAGPHPVVILLHGFPGNEKNLDLAQALRRAGFDVLFFNYRGSWGSPGDFSFTHCMEDTQAAIAFLRDPANAASLRADRNHITLAGHSMGGMIAAHIAATDPKISSVVLISAADMAGRTNLPADTPPAARQQALARIAASLAREGLAPLAGTSADALAAELVAHSAEWSLAAQASGLASRPLLDIASDDGTAPANQALVAAMQQDGAKSAKSVHFATDHSYSDQRIGLESAIISWLTSPRN